MKIVQLILKEIMHRKLNFLLSLTAMVTAVALFVSFFTTGEASKRETARLMRDMGFNLRIVPRDTVMDRFLASGYSDLTMPEEYVYRLASHEGLSYTHLTATLHKKVSWRGMEALLTGISPEISPPDKPKPPMIFTVKPGTVYVGYELARALGIQAGDEIEILGKTFNVVKCLPETGGVNDIRVYGNLQDIQGLLNLSGKINEIMALECLCRDPTRRSIDILREELSRVLPEAKVIQIREKAEAREKQRLMVEGYFALALPFVVVVCAVWIGALATINTRERQCEIGILRALGYGSARIGALFLGKAILIGLAGAVLGFIFGTGLAMRFGPEIFKLTAKFVRPMYALLGVSLLAAPAFAALATFIPAMIAVTQDPADTLREE